jgi:hypothetical protein
MARYNSALASNSISGATTIGSPYSGAFTNLTGTAPYTVTLPSPGLFPGSNQTFYNATAGIITLSSPSGSFNGTGGSNASTVLVYAGNVVSVTSDGTNYIVISEDGSAMTATTGAFSSNVTVSGTLTVQPSGGVSMAPSSAGSIDNVSIGASARSSGAFTTLAANGQVSFTANTASSSTSTGSLTITGGLGVSGSINATNVTANLTGTIQTAAQPNITSTGILTIPGLTVDSGTLYVDTTNDRVGVGTTGPQTVLELATTASINSSNYGQIKHLTLSRSEATRYNAYAGFGDQFGANTFGWRFGTVNNSTDYPTLYMVNGNVGIGTTASPNNLLQINSAASMASSGSVVDILSLTANDGVSNGVAGARIGLTISAQSNISDRRIGIYATSNAPNFNTPDITFWASAQGVAYREITRISAANGYVGLGTGANPSAKLHVVASTPSGLGAVPANSNVIVDSNSNNYLTFRNQADNATNAGLLMQDNNVGGYLVFRNYDSGNAAISDRMFLAGYQGVNIQYGTSDNADVTARTTSASFDSTGVFWEKRKLVYSQDIAAPTGFVANTWFRLSGYEFNNALDTGGTQPGWIIQIRFANLNPSYGYITWVTAEIPPLSSNTYTGYQGGYTSSHYGNNSVYGSLVFNSTHHTSAGANHDIRLKLDSPSNYDVMNLYIWSNTGNSSSYPLTYRVWKI